VRDLNNTKGEMERKGKRNTENIKREGRGVEKAKRKPPPERQKGTKRGLREKASMVTFGG